MVFRFPLDEAKYGPLRLAGVFELRHDAHWWLRSEEAYPALAIGEEKKRDKARSAAASCSAIISYNKDS
jgi:hypothetical protein